MPRYLSGVVGEILAERDGFQRVRVDDRLAYVLTHLIGTVAVGDEVLLNVTATDLALGTGGWDVVHWNLSRREWEAEGGGHIMKLRYTSLQADTGSAEEHDPKSPDRLESALGAGLDGFPVLATFLHSQLAPAALAFSLTAPGRKLGWVMTDSAALPLVLSDLAADLVDRGLLHTTVSTGQSFGGQIEAVNVLSGLEAARSAGCDAVIVGPGPGVVGTDSRHGFSGLEVAGVVDLAGQAGADVMVALRWSDADARSRHRGVSHHSRTVLSLCTRGATVVVAAGYEVSDLPSRHEIQTVDAGDPAAEMAAAGLVVTSMGRGVAADPGFFAMAAAAGRGLGARAVAFGQSRS